MKKITLKNTHSSILNTTILKKAIIALSICFIGLQLNAQGPFIETFDNLAGTGGINGGSPVSFQGTSGVTYTREATGVFNVNATTSDIGVLLRVNGGVSGYVDFPLANGVKDIKFNYQKAYAS